MTSNNPPAPPPGQPNPYGVSPHGAVPTPPRGQPIPHAAPPGQPQNPYPQAPPPSAQEARQSTVGKPPNTGFGRATLAALIWAAVNLVISLIAFPPESSQQAGTFAGVLLVPMLLAALGTWLIARTRPNGLRFWQLALIALPIFLVISVLMNAAMLAQVSAGG